MTRLLAGSALALLVCWADGPAIAQTPAGWVMRASGVGGVAARTTNSLDNSIEVQPNGLPHPQGGTGACAFQCLPTGTGVAQMAGELATVWTSQYGTQLPGQPFQWAELSARAQIGYHLGYSIAWTNQNAPPDGPVSFTYMGGAAASTCAWGGGSDVGYGAAVYDLPEPFWSRYRGQKGIEDLCAYSEVPGNGEMGADVAQTHQDFGGPDDGYAESFTVGVSRMFFRGLTSGYDAMLGMQVQTDTYSQAYLRRNNQTWIAAYGYGDYLAGLRGVTLAAVGGGAGNYEAATYMRTDGFFLE